MEVMLLTPGPWSLLTGELAMVLLLKCGAKPENARYLVIAVVVLTILGGHVGTGSFMGMV